jgi:CRP-like cAMP-binding protein
VSDGAAVEPVVTHSLVTALRAVPGFSALDDHTLLGVVGDAANLFWRGGSVVFEKGSPADGLYVVLSGAVRILDDGVEVNVLRRGDFFGEFSLVLATDHMNDVVAAEDTELMVVPKEAFDRLLASSSDLGAQVRQKLEERLPDPLRARLTR